MGTTKYKDYSITVYQHRRPQFLGTGRQGSRARQEGCDELQAGNDGLDERVTAVIESHESLRNSLSEGGHKESTQQLIPLSCWS